MSLCWFAGQLVSASVTLLDFCTKKLSKLHHYPCPPVCNCCYCDYGLDFGFSIHAYSSIPPSHSKISYAMPPCCQPPSSVSRTTIPPILDHGGPPNSPKTGRNAPQNTPFSFVDALSWSSQNRFTKKDKEVIKQGHRHKLRALVRENVKKCENL